MWHTNANRLLLRIWKYWRVCRITPFGELQQPGRITAAAIRLTTQVFLLSCLWQALYSGTEMSAELTEGQATSYAVLAVLAKQIRTLDRTATRDALIQHVQEGTILYWFLRPIRPRRYYVIRAIGDQFYGLLWLAAGYCVCLAAGVIIPPSSAGAALASAVSLCLGQVILYHLLSAIDLLCFWTIVNQSAVRILQFVQNMLSGYFAPLWFFPAWFVTANSFLPFAGTLHIPISLYVGRIPLSDAFREITVQAVWCVFLSLTARRLWVRAEAHLTIQGG
ncbi:ABC-2 family transporter protein [Streptomyces sp. NPDC102384]|uniref:ABC-2 family transporter protein n=1 Tax=Streptomyces sp. NPDC102384 TaxID=3366166 RepID=UPI0038254602